MSGDSLNTDVEPPAGELPLVVEVKNVHTWIYPWTRELLELIVKAGSAAVAVPLVPLLACPFNAWNSFLLAQDVGFLILPFATQVFHPRIDAAEFEEVRAEFELPITQHDGALDSAVLWIRRFLRQSPPPSPPEEAIACYRRQAQRFQELAPVVLDFEALAGGLNDTDRRSVYNAFKTRLDAVAPWPLVRGY